MARHLGCRLFRRRRAGRRRRTTRVWGSDFRVCAVLPSVHFIPDPTTADDGEKTYMHLDVSPGIEYLSPLGLRRG